MKIGQLALLSQIPASTIRFYEQSGLMPKAQRTQSGYRDYDESALRRLRLIRFSQGLGFSLQEMPKLMEQDGNWDHETLLQRLLQKHQDASQLIIQLQQQQEQLKHLITRLQTIWEQGKCMGEAELDDIIQQSNVL